MAKGVLIAAMDFSNVAEDEFNDCTTPSTSPSASVCPAFLSASAGSAADNPKQSVATYDLENVSVLQGPGYRAIGGENLSPWSKASDRRVQRLVRFEGDQILPGDQVAPETAGGLLLVGMTPAPAVETAFNAWYDTEHVPALARVPGVLCARRFRTSGGNPKYVGPLPPRLTRSGRRRGMEAASGSTPMPEHIRPQIGDRAAPRLPKLPPLKRAACDTSSITGPRFRVAASSSAWRWRKAAADYVDVAREADGKGRCCACSTVRTSEHPPFAPPYLKAGEMLIVRPPTSSSISGRVTTWLRSLRPGSFWAISCS